MVDSSGNLANQVLLGILWTDGFKKPLKRCDVAGSRGASDSRIDSHQVSGLCSAAGVSGAADTGFVNVGTGFEIIEGADPIPDLVTCKGMSQQKGQCAQLCVFCGSPEIRGAILLQVSKALPLADWIIGQYSKPTACQIDPTVLIGLHSLCFEGVPTRPQDCRVRGLPLLREIEISGDREVWP
ncbi:MAG: hypothetical protein DIKNOCCD_01277 [bacterium]|nr:hypothetical protein [bacterium]